MTLQQCRVDDSPATLGTAARRDSTSMTTRRRFSRTLAMAFIGAALVPALGVGVSAAEDIPIVLLGRVEWIAAEVMVITLGGRVLAAGAPPALNVDLSHVDQDEYQGLVMGDTVLVMGVVPSARNRVIATSVQRLAS